MPRQVIDTGTLALNGADGDTNRDATDKINANFQELYGNDENFVRGAGVVPGGALAVFAGTTGNQLAAAAGGAPGTAAFRNATEFASAAQGVKADNAQAKLSPGSGILIDNTDPLNPIISATATGGGDVATVAGVAPFGGDVPAAGLIPALGIDQKLGKTETAAAAVKLQTPRTINGVAFDGTANISVEDSSKEPVITPGTGDQYWTGAKAWASFAAAVRTAVLTGLDTSTSVAVVAADSVLGALGKLQAQATALGVALAGKLSLSGGTLSGALNNAPAVPLTSASTVDVGAIAANTVSITGTTAITGLGTIAAGARRTLIFGSVLTLTHDATKLILPGAANIVTAVGDVAGFESLGAGNWKCVGYVRANGRALVTDASSLIWGGIGGTLSDQTDLQAALNAKLNNNDLGYAYIYPNGTSGSPYSLPVNTRLTAANPFPGSPVVAQVELKIGGVWAEPGFDGNTGSGALSYGVRSGQIADTDLIVVQSGFSGVGFAVGAQIGGLHGGSSSVTVTTAPVRVKVFKGKGTL